MDRARPREAYQIAGKWVTVDSAGYGRKPFQHFDHACECHCKWAQRCPLPWRALVVGLEGVEGSNDHAPARHVLAELRPPARYQGPALSGSGEQSQIDGAWILPLH